MLDYKLLSDYLMKHYSLKHDTVMLMIEDEYDYIEHIMYENNPQIKELAQELIDIYMV